MNARMIKENIYWLGAVDWDRRLFDALIPLPDGTSYNAYLIQGTQKTVLIDTVDPSMKDVLLAQLENVPKIDYLISLHSEQDHSGSIPDVLRKYPDAQLITSNKGKLTLPTLLAVDCDKILAMKDGETLDLGGKTLRFVYTPWVHWPETMCAYLVEDRILFTCDWFGSHLATSDLFAPQDGHSLESSKRYYAEIMMPFHTMISDNLKRIEALEIEMIAPSHGPIHSNPARIINAYKDWVFSEPKNLVMIPYVSMHGSTAAMVNHLRDSLVQRGVKVEQFNLLTVDLGKLAMTLVDAATLVLGTPTILGGAHPGAVQAAYLVNALRPKTKFISLVGSYGWGGKVLEQITGMLSNIQAEILPPVICKGAPLAADLSALDNLAELIATKHKSLGIT
jgi:flavorubredoxin